MRKFLAIIFVLCLIVGCTTLRELRIDDFAFGNKRTGLRTENPTFKAGEDVYLNYAIRGMAPDSSGNGKLSYKITVTQIDDPVIDIESRVFKVNSDLTSLGPSKPHLWTVPSSLSGPQILQIEVVDEIAGTRIVNDYPFTVEGGSAD